MNRWYISGQSLALYVEFKKDSEYVQPDPGSIKLTIRDNFGLVIPGYNHAAQPDISLTTALYNIPSSVNIVNEGRETRYVRVDFTSFGVPCSFIDTYKLTEFIPITVEPSDVRGLFGVREKELPDEDIDLLEAYFQLTRSNSDITSALVTTDDRAMYANKAIALKAALNVLPSMPVRTVKEDALNTASLIRGTIDWDVLSTGLKDQLNLALSNMGSLVDPDYVFNPVFLVVTPVDVITNA